MIFNPIPANAILAWKPGPTKWVWEHFVPEGALFLFSGFMKTGKSTFISSLLINVAQGKPFLDKNTKKSAVLLINLEERWLDVRDRLEKFGMKTDDPIYVHCGPLKNDPLTLDALKGFIVSKQIGLVLVDTLSMLWSVVDENSNAQVLQQVKPLLELARSTNCSIGLIHHTSKAGGKHGRSIRGASSLFGLVDLALILERRQGGRPNQRVLKTLGRFAETPDELIIELEGTEYICLGSGSEAMQREQEALDLHALRQGPKSVEEVGQISDLSAKQARRSLEALLSLNKLKRAGEGKKNDPYMYSLA